MACAALLKRHPSWCNCSCPHSQADTLVYVVGEHLRLLDARLACSCVLCVRLALMAQAARYIFPSLSREPTCRWAICTFLKAMARCHSAAPLVSVLLPAACRLVPSLWQSLPCSCQPLGTRAWSQMEVAHNCNPPHCWCAEMSGFLVLKTSIIRNGMADYLTPMVCAVVHLLFAADTHTHTHTHTHMSCVQTHHKCTRLHASSAGDCAGGEKCRCVAGLCICTKALSLPPSQSLFLVTFLPHSLFLAPSYFSLLSAGTNKTPRQPHLRDRPLRATLLRGTS